MKLLKANNTHLLVFLLIVTASLIKRTYEDDSLQSSDDNEETNANDEASTDEESSGNGQLNDDETHAHEDKQPVQPAAPSPSNEPSIKQRNRIGSVSANVLGSSTNQAVQENYHESVDVKSSNEDFDNPLSSNDDDTDNQNEKDKSEDGHSDGEIDENTDGGIGGEDSEDLSNNSVNNMEDSSMAQTPTVRHESSRSKLISIISKPGILAGIVGGAIIGILTAILLIMFIVYRMRKKDEGSYALEETKKPLNSYDYRHCPTREFYA
jgi:syndecan 2